jgi:hypothetical protein
MKPTYNKKYFDFALIAFSLLFFLDSAVSLFDKFDYLSSYLLRVIWTSFSVLSLISLGTSKLNGERYSRAFILINLVLPSTLVFIQCLADLLFYGAIRTDLLQNPTLYIKLVIGIILLILSLKFSNEQKLERIRNYGILTILVGLFVVLFTFIVTIESSTKSFTDIAFVIKTMIGLLIIFLGVKLRSEKVKFRTFLILLLTLAFIGRI